MFYRFPDKLHETGGTDGPKITVTLRPPPPYLFCLIKKNGAAWSVKLDMCLIELAFLL